MKEQETILPGEGDHFFGGEGLKIAGLCSELMGLDAQEGQIDRWRESRGVDAEWKEVSVCILTGRRQSIYSGINTTDFHGTRWVDVPLPENLTLDRGLEEVVVAIMPGKGQLHGLCCVTADNSLVGEKGLSSARFMHRGCKIEFCEVCIRGKMLSKRTQKTWGELDEKVKNFNDLVAIDLVGPSKPGMGEKKYAVVLVDDKTRCVQVTCIKRKSDAETAIKEWIKNNGRPVKIRADQAKEITKEAVIAGVPISLSPAYRHCANGKAERHIRTLTEMARCAPVQSSLDHSYWPLALTYAAFFHNRVPSSDDKTSPYQRRYGDKGLEKNLFAFGSPVYYLPAVEKRVKSERFEHRAKRRVFVGVVENSGEILVLDGGKAIRAGDYRIDESGYYRDVMLRGGVNGDRVGEEKQDRFFFTEEETADVGSEDHGTIWWSGAETFETPPSLNSETSASAWLNIMNFFANTDDDLEDRRSIQHRPAPRRLHKLFHKAKKKELGSFIENECQREPTKEERRSAGKPVSTKWVLTLKPLAPGEQSDWGELRRECECEITEKNWKRLLEAIPHRDGRALVKPKARLVARGFEEQLNKEYAASPTVSVYMIRIAISVGVILERSIFAVDIPNAFLRGDKLPRLLMLTVPPELKERLQLSSSVALAIKPVYGINDAPLRFWSRVDRYMTGELNLTRLTGDSCVWWGDDVIILAHADDILCIAKDNWAQTVLEGKIMKDWGIKEMQKGNFTHCGVDIQQDEKGIRLTQENYVCTLEEIKLTDAENVPEMSDDLLSRCQKVCGEINWVATRTRPDLSFLVGEAISLLATRRTDLALPAINKAVRMAKKYKHFSLFFPYFPHSKAVQHKLVAYSDAAHRFEPPVKGGSIRNTGGVVYGLESVSGDGTVLSCMLLHWHSFKLRRVSISSTHSELLALRECCDFSLFFQGLFGPLAGPFRVNVEIRTKPSVFTDSKNIVDLINSTPVVHHPTARRLVMFIEQMREYLLEGEIEKISHVAGEKNLADMLTKDVRAESLMNVLAVGSDGWEVVGDKS